MTEWYWQKEGDSIVVYEKGHGGEPHYICGFDARRIPLADLGLAVYRATEIVNAHNAKESTAGETRLQQQDLDEETL